MPVLETGFVVSVVTQLPDGAEVDAEETSDVAVEYTVVV